MFAATPPAQPERKPIRGAPAAAELEDDMDEFSVPLLAQVISKAFARASGWPLTDEMLRDLAHRIETGMRTAVHHQRESFAAQCDARVELWTRTEQRAGVPENLRTEARARANEAAYLADAVRVQS